LPTQAATVVSHETRRKPARRPLPAELPRETETIAPAQEACPDCGGTLRMLGEDVCETLEYVPARFKVIRTVRPKLSCVLDRLIQDRASDKGPATLGLYLTKIARLGGYLARAQDGPPGNTVMWRGVSRLTDIELGFIMGAQLVGN
jgi:hypothetical protein